MKTLITSHELRAMHPYLPLRGHGAAAHLARLTGIQRQRAIRIGLRGEWYNVIFWSTADHDHWRGVSNYEYIGRFHELMADRGALNKSAP